MNNTRNNTLAIGIVAVLVVLLVATCAGMFGLAVGLGIGQARARAQLEEIVERAPESGPSATPAFPALPFTPDTPDIPQMPDLDQMMQMMSGALVTEVVAGGPAEQAGIEPGDVIVAVDGDEITSDTTLPELIGSYAPGDGVALTVIRMSRGEMNQEEITVTLGANPNDESLGFLGVFVVPFFQNEEPGSP